MKQPTPPPPPDAAARETIRREVGTSLLIEAAAGTGKTTSLVERMVELLATGACQVDRLVAVTFTRKAAAELRSRFAARLEAAADTAAGDAGDGGERARRLREAAGRAEASFIGTIHAFCARLLRERPIEAGVPVDFRELDEDADQLLRERAWHEFAARLHAGADPRVAQLKRLGLGLADLRDAFLRIAAYPDVDEWPAPAVDLGDLGPARTALASYLERIRALCGTFPDDRGTDRLMNRYETIARVARRANLDEPAELMELLEEFDCGHGAIQRCWPGGRKGAAKGEIECWEGFRAQTVAPALARWREVRYAAVVPLLRSAVDLYGRMREEAGVLNFQDLLQRAAQLLRDKPAVRRYFRERVTHLLVDEFQDTDPLQAQVVLYLTASDPDERDWRKCRPRPGSLCVVGDPKQSIYRFRRADIQTYQMVKGYIEQAGGEVVALDASFRTLPSLVDWGNEVFSSPAGFPAAGDRYSPPAHPLTPRRPAAKPVSGALEGVLTLTVPPEHGTSDACAAWDADRIARWIRRALDEGLPVPRTPAQLAAGVPPAATPGDFLVVTWRKAHLSWYAARLQELGVPHLVSGGSAWGEVGELGLLADLLRAVVEPENPVALAGVLRGGLFGFSDVELYDVARAGGGFRYTLGVPAALAEPLRGRLVAAFERLRRWAGLLRNPAPVAALERIADESGLALRAVAAPGGDGRAGSIAKAFAMLREQGLEPGSPAGLADLLEQLIEDQTPFDGLPARAGGPSVVRVMNLHKAKGLEAPVVFLADPGGKPRVRAELHVDRSGDRTVGYLVVDKAKGAYQRTVLAQPPGWEALAAEEARFLEAEQKRLLYVAATRAGTRLVVSRRAGKGASESPWEALAPWLAGAPELPDPGEQRPPEVGSVTVTVADEDAAQAAVAARWEASLAPTYAVGGAKQIAIDAAAEPGGGPRAGEHGTEWGTAIHALLETALRDPGRDLRAVAVAALEEQGLSPSLADDAAALVRAVQASELWRRAVAAGRLLVETPFTVCLEPGHPLLPEAKLPTIVRGVVDLAFREAAGWVVVDWKTDAARSDEEVAERKRHYAPQVRLYAEFWARLSGEAVAESGLYFTATQRYERL